MAYKFVKIVAIQRFALDYFYKKYPHTSQLSFSEHKKLMLKERYGMFDYYEQNLRKMGQESDTIVWGDKILNEKWAQENGLEIGNQYQILVEQIKNTKPVVLFINATLPKAQIELIREKVRSIKLILGWCCSPYNENVLEALSVCDYTIICSALFKQDLESKGIKTFEINHGFEESILDELPKIDQTIDVSFIGTIASGKGFHNQRKAILEELVNKGIDFSFYGNIPKIENWKIKAYPFLYPICLCYKKIGRKCLPMKIEYGIDKVISYPRPQKIVISKGLYKSLREPVFGMDMYKLLAESKISLNTHGDIVNRYAANMRLFEATGVGSCLLTDYKDNLKDFFIPDEEVVTYKNSEECAEKIKYLIAHPMDAKKIALNGQKKCLAKHSGYVRTEKLNNFITEKLNSITSINAI